jgi:hypothetical protein
MAGVRMDATSAMEKWAQRTAGATQEMAAGINRVTEAPGAKAAAKSAKWLAAVTAAEGKFKRNVGRVTLDSWTRAALEVGVPRVASGVQAKKQKWGDFAAEFFPYLDQGIQRVQAMPDTDFEARIARMVAMVRHTHGFQRSATAR